jgi:neutral ceramidase
MKTCSHPLFATFLTTFLAACDDNTIATRDAATDTATDTAVDQPVLAPQSTSHCTYEALPPNAHAGTTVESMPLRAGAAEAMLDLPVGSALGAYTARARALGSQNAVDAREVTYPAGFLPSGGVERSPRVRAVVLSAGGENIVILKADLGASDDSTTVDVAAALGPEYIGKVVFATSHSHSAWGHTVANEILGLGFGKPRLESRRRLVEILTATARRAIENLVPARIGIAHDDNFDPMDRVTRDRRENNDDLPGGMRRKDRDLFVVRVDRMDGSPIAVIPIFGIHGTVLGEANNLASGDAPGGVEQAVEESFSQPVVVMHLQGAAGDVSPGGTAGINCENVRACYEYARIESIGHYAVGPIRAAWTTAGASMTDRAALEMVTRAIPLGPDWRTFSVRNGALNYAPFDLEREADREIFATNGSVLTPIDEFNAPFGAGLCGDRSRTALPISAAMPNTLGLFPYKSCSRVEALTPLLGPALDLDLPQGVVPCGTTRTIMSALRINEHVFVTLPGEPVTLLVDKLRAGSPVAPGNTVVIGYAQGHMGYILHAEDWLRGGYEPSINVWGPLEGEYLMERSLELARLAMSPMRDNGANMTGLWRPPVPAAQPAPDAAPLAGTVPTSIPETLFLPSVVRGATLPTRGQPDATIARLGIGRFIWIGEDPRAGTPKITLQRETMAGTFVAVTRFSGRAVQDTEVLLSYTPNPLNNPNMPRTHYWAAEWQAVTPIGTVFPDDISNRPGVALGRYRFHIEGNGYMINSDAFTVTPATLTLSATRNAASVTVTVGYNAPTGWRMLDLTGNSNRLVPLRTGDVTATLTLMDGSTRMLAAQRTNAMGQLMIPDATMVRTVSITDRHGNVGTVTP